MIRIFDIILSMVGLLLGAPVMILVYVFGFFDTGSPIFRQIRVGRDQCPFTLIKFRTMKPGTPSLSTHLIGLSDISRFGLFLRRTKLDELPQLWNVLMGDMSLVGPRPCLFNQFEVIQHRHVRNVFSIRPGITGLAQIKGIDMSKPKLLARVDARMVNSFSLVMYFVCIFLTLRGDGSGDRLRTNSN